MQQGGGVSFPKGEIDILFKNNEQVRAGILLARPLFLTLYLLSLLVFMHMESRPATAARQRRVSGRALGHRRMPSNSATLVLLLPRKSVERDKAVIYLQGYEVC